MCRGSTLSLPTLLVLAGLWATARSGAVDVCYPGLASATITACVPYTGRPEPTPCAGDGPKPWIKSPGPDAGIVTVAVPMPPCLSCGCPTCVWTDSYTTTLASFCPTGLVNKPYVIQELYTGLAMKPSVTRRPELPHGFTTEVQTCTSCGAKPLTATITFPDTKYPWATDLSGPVPGPSGAPAWVVRPEGSDRGWIPAPAPPVAEGAGAGVSPPAWIPFVGMNAAVNPVSPTNKNVGTPLGIGNNASVGSFPMGNKNGGTPPVVGNSRGSGVGVSSPKETTGSEKKPDVTAAASVPHFINGAATASALLFVIVMFLV